MHQPDRLQITQVITTGSFAGTERYTIDVGGELARRGHDVHIIGGDPTTMQALVSAPVRWSPGATTVEALTALARAGRRDIVHSHITKADFVAAMAAPVTGGKRISTRHIIARRGYSPLAARLARGVRELQAREIAVSSFVAESVETTVDAILLNGVRTEPDHDGPREQLVVVAQRLAAEKDTGLALRAWAESGLAERGWRLAVAGDGPQRADLIQLSVELGVQPSVDFLGWVTDLPALLARASMLLATAPAEPCGLVVLEAMAHGVAVIATRSGGHLETVGLDPFAALFEPGDAGAAAAQLVRLADDETGRAGYARWLTQLQRDRFSIDAHVDELELIYLGALGPR